MSMFKTFVALSHFNLNRINAQILLLLSGLYVIVTVYGVAGVSSMSYLDPDTGMEMVSSGNIWRAIYSLFAENFFLSIPIFLICIYCVYCIFKGDIYEDKAKIRSGNYLKYINAKMLLVFGINSFVCLGAFLVTFLISMLFFDIKWGWDPECEFWYPYMQFYSVWRFSSTTIISYVTVISALSYLFGIALTRIRHHLIGPASILVYLVFQSFISQLDPMIKGVNGVKLFCMSTYLMTGERKLYADTPVGNGYAFLTVTQGVVIPVVACMVIYTLIILTIQLKIIREG